jgi:hypothetical protein
MTIEFSLRHGLDAGANNGGVGLKKYPFWEGALDGPNGMKFVNAGRRLLNTADNGTLTDLAGKLLDKRDPKSWVKVTLRLELTGDKLTVGYWVDDQLKGRQEVPGAKADAECGLLEFSVGHGSLWIDEVKVMREGR